MRRVAYLLISSVLGLACSGLPPPNDGGNPDGAGGGTANADWIYQDLDTHALHTQYFSIATDYPNSRIGVAYFVDTGEPVLDAGNIDAGLHDGTNNWDIHYLEWQSGQVSGQKTIKTVQRPVGISLAFAPNGEPTIAYLGGNGQDGASMSNYWFQSDPEMAQRSGGVNGSWTITVSGVKTSTDLISGDTQMVDMASKCSLGPDLVGFVLGLWPAIAYDSAGDLYWAFRDVHSGQFPQQDWGASDLKVLSGTNVPPSMKNWCVKSGSDDKGVSGGGWGGHNQMVIGPNDLPAIIMDQEPIGPDNDGQGTFFLKLQANGNWSNIFQVNTATNTQTGASLAYDPMEGFGVAWADIGNSQKLYYVNSSNGDPGTWQTATPVFGSGSGGWFPSLAMDPTTHEPSVSFYICSNTGGKPEGNCTQEDSLSVSQRISGHWQSTPKLVDDFGQVAALDNVNRVINKLGFFSNGKRFVVYRPPQGDSLRLAVEK